MLGFVIVIPLLSVAVNKSVAQIVAMLISQLKTGALLEPLNQPVAKTVLEISSVVEFAPLLVLCVLFLKDIGAEYLRFCCSSVCSN
jgi:uncharacterized oligopeptide transporter (OPT) family protein